MSRQIDSPREWWLYNQLSSAHPYDWAPATRGDRPWDQLDFHLDLGAGRVPKGRLGIDKRISPGKTDLVIDLETLLPADLADSEAPGGRDHKTEDHYKSLPGAHGYIFPCLPFDDGSIASIITHHAFEHIGLGFEHLMEECYRVLKWGGAMRIIVPLFPSYSAVAEYDHKRYFMQGSLQGFCQEPGDGPSMYDGFSERYNTACFRMVDEDFSPPSSVEDQWTPNDAREIRTTLVKIRPDEEMPEPADFMTAAQWDDYLATVEDGEPAKNREPLKSDVLTRFLPQKPLYPDVREEPFASVCVLSYERPELLKECIGSMLAHAEADFELIVHDDGSVDPGLRQWLLKLSEDGIISTLIMNSPGWNEGQGVAMNRMAAVAKGDPIIKCDQDLVFGMGWLRKVNEVLRLNREAVGPSDGDIEPMIGALGLFKYEVDPVDHRKMHIADRGSYDEVQDFVGSFLAMPRAAWGLFGPWDEYSDAFAEDALYKKKVTETDGWCCALTKEDLVTNEGFGVGPSTVVIAGVEGVEVQKINHCPKIYTPQGF